MCGALHLYKRLGARVILTITLWCERYKWETESQRLRDLLRDNSLSFPRPTFAVDIRVNVAGPQW